jgi:WD40 repeat protein
VTIVFHHSSGLFVADDTNGLKERDMKSKQGAKERWLLVVAVVLGTGQWALGQQVEPWATLRGHKKLVTSLAFSPDCRTLASASLDETIKLWEVASGRERLTLRGRVRDDVVFSPDGKLLAAGGASSARLWDVVGTPRAPRRSFPDAALTLAFSPDGRTLAVGLWDFSERPQQGMLRLWDVRTGARRPGLLGRTGAVHAIAFSPDGRTVAAGDDKGTVTFWEMVSGGVRMTRHVHGVGSVYALGFVAGVKVMASGSSHGPVRLWETDTGRVRAFLGPLDAGVWDLALSKDGKLLASGNPGIGLRLWDTVSGKELLIVDLGSSVRAVRFSPDGKVLAASDDSGTIRIWSVPKLLAHKGKK